MKLRERCVKVAPKQFPTEVFLKRHTQKLYDKLKDIEKVPNELLEFESSKYDSVYFTQVILQIKNVFLCCLYKIISFRPT